MKFSKKEEAITVSYSDKGIKNQHYEKVPFEKIVNEIQNPSDHNLDLIDKIRKLSDQIKVEENDQNRKELDREKRELKCILAHFSMAEFRENYRSNDNFISSQFMIIDIDKCEDVQSLKEKLKKDNRVFVLFVSPSGDGLKVIFWFDKPITSVEVFKANSEHIAEEFSKEYEVEVDRTFDAARACFISYDTDLYINYNCERLTVDIDSLNISNSKSESSTKDKSFINNWDGVKEGRRKNELVKHVGECIQKGIQVDVASLLLMEWNKKNSPPLEKEEIIDTVEDVYNRYNDVVTKFLHYDAYNRLNFDHYEFKLFLESNGFYKYKLSSGYAIIRIINNLVRLVEPYEIKDFVINRISDKRKKNHIIEKAKTIFDSDRLDFLNIYNGGFHCDTATSCYKYYKNGFVEITSDSISQLKPYDELPKPIWERQIIDIEFTLIADLELVEGCEFNRFLKNAMKQDDAWYESLISAFGYLNHNYYDPALRKAILLIDEELPEDVNTANGGVGKSICGRALREVIPNSEWVDSSNLKAIKPFTFQSIRPDTNIIINDDLNSEFEFSTMFSIITEGLTVEKKYKSPFIIENVKFLITSNFTIGGKGNSYDRRLSEHEFCQYYNPDYTPQQEFGHNLLDEWDDQERLLFHNLFLHFIQFYLKKGKILSYKKVTLEKKKFIRETCREFYDFSETLAINQPYNIKDLLRDYNDVYAPMQIKQNTLTKWLNLYAPLRGCKLDTNRTNGNKMMMVKLVLQCKGIRKLKAIKKLS